MDPFALTPDGTAVDPKAFQEALRAEAALMAEISADGEAAAVLLGDDIPAFQALLKQVYEAEVEKAKRRAASLSERTIDAQRAAAPVPRDTVQLYEQLKKSGLQYGPAFRLLRNVHVPEVKK